MRGTRKTLCLLIVVSALATAQDSMHLNVSSGRPLLTICEQLEQKFHWRITYEEPPMYSQNQLEPAIAPSGVPWLALRPVCLSVDVPMASAASTPQDASAGKAATLMATKKTAWKTILDAYNSGANRDAFRVVESGDFIHVVPSAVRGEDGVLRPFQPVFDTPVTIAKGSYLLLVFVNQILTQVSNKTGIPIMEGTIPMNLFAQTMVTDGAANEPARDVLMRVFDEVDAQRADPLHLFRLTWNLGYSPNLHNYVWNVHPVGSEQPGSSSTASQPPPPAAAPKPSDGPPPYGVKKK